MAIASAMWCMADTTMVLGDWHNAVQGHTLCGALPDVLWCVGQVQPWCMAECIVALPMQMCCMTERLEVCYRICVAGCIVLRGQMQSWVL